MKIATARSAIHQELTAPCQGDDAQAHRESMQRLDELASRDRQKALGGLALKSSHRR